MNAIVTGSNRGIGKAIVAEFAKNGYNVWACARKQNDDFEEWLNSLSKQYNVTLTPVYFDLSDEEAIKAGIKSIIASKERIDDLVNNAGVMHDGLIGMISSETIKDTFAINVYAPIIILQYVARVMTKQGGGSIINLTSVVGIKGNPGQLVYSASKGAVISMTKTAAKELADKQVRVNAIAPGVIDTELFRSVSEGEQKKKIDSIQMGRIGTPEDIATACLFLASDSSEYITGQIISVDGAVKM